MSVPKFKFNQGRLTSAAKAIEEGEKGSVYPSVITLPAGISWFKVKEEGTYTIDILAFPVSNPLNPAVRRGEVAIGEFDFHLKAYVHQRQGEASEDLLCLKDAGKRTCPCCEEFFAAKNAGDADGQKKFRRTERSFMIVHDHKDGKIKVWDASAYAFTKELLTEASDDSNGGRPVFFFHPDEGKSVQFKAVPGSLAKSFDYKRIRFIDRDPKEGQRLHGLTFSLDQTLKVVSADEMSRIMFGGPADASHEDTQTQHSRTEPEEDGMDPDAFGAPEPAAAKDPEEAPEEKPTKVEATPAPVASKAPEGDSKCPYGHSYGTDWGDTPDCKMCRRTHKDLEAVCADGGN